MGDTTLKDIFFEAAELPPERRDALLDERCAGDERLRARVRALLDANDEAGDFMAEPTTGVIDAPSGLPERPAPAEPHTPQHIGRYTTVRALGEGGYGTVYLARQTEPVRRDVALKIIKPGMDSRQVIRRFEAERQTLALMDHPNIARVLDAGTTEKGRPYFVMELVDGRPVTTWCDQKRLTIPERLRLFEQVCVAVQHAHQKGIIHRDLKPTNVLVTEVDGRPTPKVIDFGIAKALTDDGVDRTVLTEARQIIGTPQYMSPEQATASDDIDTRSDVYSLGVLLYELLAGVPPFEPDRLRSASVAQLERIISDEDPPRPSSRAAGLPDKADAAHDRRLDPQRLVRELRGELDWIVMRAMDKDRARRYPTAWAIGADIARFLRDEPVEAGPPSRTYRVGKFARRHRVALSVATIFVLSVAGLLAGSIVFGVRADTARRRAEAQLVRADELAEFAQSIISSVDPSVARSEDTTLLKRLLDDAAARVREELRSQPEAAVSMLNTIGFTYTQLTDYDRALEVLAEAVRRGRTELGEESETTMEAEGNLAAALIGLNQWDEAERLLRTLLERRVRVDGPDHEKTLSERSNLAYLYHVTARDELALAEWEEVLERRRRTLGPDHDDTVATMNNIATCRSDLGDEQGAAELLEQVLEHQLDSLKEDHPRTLATMNNLADSYAKLGRDEDAERMLRRVIAVKEGLFERGHPSLIISNNNLAHILMDAGRYDEAQAILEPLLDDAERSLTRHNMITITLMNTVGTLRRKQQRYDDAITVLAEAIEALHETAEGHPNEAYFLTNLAGAYREAGRIDEALDASERAETIAHGAFGPFTARSLGVDIGRAIALRAAGETDEAEARLLRAHQACLEILGPDHERTAEAAAELADLYDDAGRPDDAAHWRARLDGPR